jgi:hypothetical protein
MRESREISEPSDVPYSLALGSQGPQVNRFMGRVFLCTDPDCNQQECTVGEITTSYAPRFEKQVADISTKSEEHFQSGGVTS